MRFCIRDYLRSVAVGVIRAGEVEKDSPTESLRRGKVGKAAIRATKANTSAYSPNRYIELAICAAGIASRNIGGGPKRNAKAPIAVEATIGIARLP